VIFAVALSETGQAMPEAKNCNSLKTTIPEWKVKFAI
jgi:hypothetical protein